MNSEPLVTIVTPSFNQAPYLETTIRSVLDQDYLNIEYIVMDGGSNDGSAEIIERYAGRLAYWESVKDKGQTDAINKGFARAHGEILAWLNSDDVLYPHAVREAVSYLTEHPECGLVYGNSDFIDARGSVIGRFNAKQTNHKKLTQGYVHIPQQASFWRADLWKQVGPLDDTIYFAMDYDLWVRLAEVSEIKYLDTASPWAAFRLHADAKTIAEDDRCWPDMLRIHKRNGGSEFSVIYAKYCLRKVLGPIIRWRRRRSFGGQRG
ncbi:MAG: glycosyltransferase [Anaerolineaceae bacterium]|nr:glycosyltransferase [Anaerolineaceae bacterium]